MIENDILTAASFAVDARTTDHKQQLQRAMLVGFESGYRAACLDMAGALKRHMKRCRESNVRGVVKAEELLAHVETLAERPPMPGVVEMRPGETAEDACARTEKETPRG